MLKIAVIPGDGIGPEVVREGLKVLEAAAAATGLRYELQHYGFGGDRYLKTGEVLPEGAPWGTLSSFRERSGLPTGAAEHQRARSLAEDSADIAVPGLI